MASTSTTSSFHPAIMVGKTSLRMAVSKTLRFIKDGAVSMVEFPDGGLTMLRSGTATECIIAIGLHQPDSVSSSTLIETSTTLSKFMSTDTPSKDGSTTKGAPEKADLSLLLLSNSLNIHQIIDLHFIQAKSIRGKHNFGKIFCLTIVYFSCSNGAIAITNAQKKANPNAVPSHSGRSHRASLLK